MGNLSDEKDDDENPDGWQFRGRGPPQLTGRANYAEASQMTGLDLVRFPDLAADPFTGTLITLAYCQKRGVWRAVDRGDYGAAREAWNGGRLGLVAIAIVRDVLLDVLA